ncbi:hypothetical protein JW979_06985, partial [bacterium]|nr:hypothetical protein [candidate division CSSED10-310 bacterium]
MKSLIYTFVSVFIGIFCWMTVADAVPVQIDSNMVNEWDTLAYPNGRRMVRDADGYFHLVFHMQVPANHPPGNPPTTSNEEAAIYYVHSLYPAAQDTDPPPWDPSYWSSPVAIASTFDGLTDPRDDRYPSIAIEYGSFTDPGDNDRLHVVWQRERSTNGVYDIAYATCLNDGNCVWQDGLGSAGHRILYQSNDGGAPIERNSLVPSIAINADNHVHVVWQEENFISAFGNYYSEILYKAFTQGDNPTRDTIWYSANDYESNISQTPGLNSQVPVVACITDDPTTFTYNSSSVHIAWSDDENMGGSGGLAPNIYYIKSTDDGQTWNMANRENWSALRITGGEDGYPSMVIDYNDDPHVVFMHGVSPNDPDGITSLERGDYCPGCWPPVGATFPHPGPNPGMFGSLLLQKIYYGRDFGVFIDVDQDQADDNEFASISMDSVGNFMVVWQGYIMGEESVYEIIGSNLTSFYNLSNDFDHDDMFPSLPAGKNGVWLEGYDYCFLKMRTDCTYLCGGYSYMDDPPHKIYFDGTSELPPIPTATPVIPPTPTPYAPDQAQFFVQNQTNMGNLLCTFYNLTEMDVDVTVTHYQQNGTLEESNVVALRPHESRTLDVAQEWGLMSGIHGVTAFGTDGFSMLVAPDRIEFASPTSTSLHPQGVLLADSWWGMYNPSGNGYQKWDFFYAFNPNPVPASPTFDVYDTNGNYLRSFYVNLPAYGTEQVFLHYLPDGQGSITQQNVGIHMTTELRQCINVYTTIGGKWNSGSSTWQEHKIADAFVPFPDNHNGTELMWEQDDWDSACRATNITSQPADYILEGWNFTGGYYWKIGQISAYGTVELPPPTSITGSGPFNYKLTSTQLLATHAQYNNEIVTPEVTAEGQTSFQWGLTLSGTGGATQSGVGLFNPAATSVDIYPVAYYYQYGSLQTQTASTISLGGHSAVRLLYRNIFTLPSGVDDMTMHFSADGNFGCLVEGPNFSDAEPLIGGDVFQTYGLFFYPDHLLGWSLPDTVRIYDHAILNDGSVPDSYVIEPPVSSEGWTWEYFQDDGTGNPTGPAIWTIPTLQPGNYYYIVAVVTVPAVPAGTVDTTIHKIKSASIDEFFDTCIDVTTVMDNTPTPTNTPPSTGTPTPINPTNTPDPSIPTDTPTIPEPTQPPPPTWTPAPTWTPYPTRTETPLPSSTPLPSATPTITPTPTMTYTAPPTWTPLPPTITPTSTTTATPTVTPTISGCAILLVDDDNNSPDMLDYYTAALQGLGYGYNVFDVGAGTGNGPTASQMALYDVVIWFSGDKRGSMSAGPNSTDEANLTTF